MTIKVRVGATLRTASAVKVRVAGVLRNVESVRVKHGGSLRTVFIGASPLSVTISPPSINRSGASSTLGDGATAIVSGGIGPYSYNWTKLSGDSNVNLTSSTMATAGFLATGLTIFEPSGAQFQVAVTDAVGGTGFASINTTFNRTG